MNNSSNLPAKTKLKKTAIKLNPQSLVSQYRAQQLNDEQNGFFSTIPQEKKSPQEFVSEYRAQQLNSQQGVGHFAKTAAGNVVVSKPKSKSIQKTASDTTTTTSSWRGTGGAVYQTPSIYSPLWLDSNLSLPRDRATINAWCRAFFTLNPYIRNSILLHSTYPISKLSIKCKNLQAKEFFEQMIEDLDLEEICVKIAQEYWMLGEAFPYAEYNEGEGKWNRIFLLNPDYVIVQKLIGGDGSILSMRPDQNLQRIVTSNNPSDKLQRQKLNPEIIEHVKRGKNIPLNEFNATHLANSNSDYEIRGQSIIVSCFRDLMLYDSLKECKFTQADNMINPWLLVKVGGATGEFKPNPVDLEFWRETIECHDEETEVLTDQGFKKYYEVIDYVEDDNKIINVKPKSGIKIACYDPDSEEESILWKEPTKAFLDYYQGDIYYFHNLHIDLKVTPNHDLLLSDLNNNWQKIKAQDVISQNKYGILSVSLNSINDFHISEIPWQIKNLKIEKYSGKVWCFTVPTGLFVTRRNGKVTIQGNSGQSNKDYKIITHDSVTIEPINRGSAIYDTSNDITQLIKNIYIGLMVPSVLMDGGSDTTYANGGVALDVLKGRYMQFRHKMSKWLRRKIFAPISKINNFYEYKKNALGEQQKVLIVPEVDWNHMSLFEMGDYVERLIQLRGQTGQDGAPGVSEQTIFRSLGLDWKEEQQKIREEQIAEAIKMKEKENLAKMSLTELRSLSPTSIIEEQVDSEPLPGEVTPGETELPGMEGLPPPPTEIPEASPPPSPPTT